jgi:hypothetical protein
MARRSYQKKMAILRDRLAKEEEHWHDLHPRKTLSPLEARYRSCLSNERKNRARNEAKYLHNLDGMQIMDTLNFKGTMEERDTIRFRSTPGYPGPDPQPVSSQWFMQFASYPKVMQGGKYREEMK